MGGGWVGVRDFWSMTPAEFWWVHEEKVRQSEVVSRKYGRMTEDQVAELYDLNFPRPEWEREGEESDG